MFQTKFVGKIKTPMLYPVTFIPRKSCLLRGVEKYGTARQATDGNKIWRMGIAC
jgi:hypothetical protein